ncbi:MAG: hypothetical protein ABI589_00690 [Burkholderiales bacterium]
MNIKSTFIVMASGCLLLSACGSRPSLTELPPEVQVACPSQQFPAFLDSFADSIALQEAFTRFPLQARHLRASGRSDPVPVDEWLNRSQVRFPLIPPRGERRTTALIVDVRDASTTVATATLYKPNTDYQVVFRFALNGCWRLEAIDNRSL